MNKEIILKHLGQSGAMICGSKTLYISANPKNLAVFNANVCVGLDKVWWGDIDVTLSKDALISLSKELNNVVFILYEMDGRFENEDEPNIRNYVVKFLPDGTYELTENLKEYYTL
jgi:hypothetical protein